MTKKAGIILCVVLGLVLLGGIGVWIMNFSNPADATYSSSWSSEGNEIYFNEVGNDSESGAANLSLPEGKKKELSLEEVNRYYGHDMSDCYIPSDLKKNNIKDKFDFYYDGDKVTSDRSTLWYSAEGESTQKLPYLEIEFEKGRIPLSDVTYQDSGIKKSTVNGKKVNFTADFAEGSSIYTAEFLNTKFRSRVSATAVSQEEFMKVIYSLTD